MHGEFDPVHFTNVLLFPTQFYARPCQRFIHTVSIGFASAKRREKLIYVQMVTHFQDVSRICFSSLDLAYSRNGR